MSCLHSAGVVAGFVCVLSGQPLSVPYSYCTAVCGGNAGGAAGGADGGHAPLQISRHTSGILVASTPTCSL